MVYNGPIKIIRDYALSLKDMKYIQLVYDIEYVGFYIRIIDKDTGIVQEEESVNYFSKDLYAEAVIAFDELFERIETVVEEVVDGLYNEDLNKDL